MCDDVQIPPKMLKKCFSTPNNLLIPNYGHRNKGVRGGGGGERGCSPPKEIT